MFPLFLIYQSWQSLSGPSGYEDLNKIKVAPHYSFEASKRAVATLRVQTEEILKTEMIKVSDAGSCLFLCCSCFFSTTVVEDFTHLRRFISVKEVHITQEDDIYARKDSYVNKEPRVGEEPKTREDFLKCELYVCL